MRIKHHFGFRVTEEQRSAFREAGLELPGGIELPRGGVMTSFEIAEDDPRWEKVVFLTNKFQIFGYASTQFSDDELASARSVGLVATGHHGYPEPSENNGYLTATFDLSNYCKTCGIGLKQVAPFRLKNRPRLGKSVLQLNWLFDEFFVTPEVWESVFEKHGVRCRPVVLDKTGAVIETVVQLEVQQFPEVNLDGRDFEVCLDCGRKKYKPSFRGFFPQPSANDAPIFKSSQYFGNGRLAFKSVMVANALYRGMREAKLRRINFYPCAE